MLVAAQTRALAEGGGLRLVISLLRLDGHANIAVANRHHARDPKRTLQLLQATWTTSPGPWHALAIFARVFAVTSRICPSRAAHCRTERSTPLTGMYAGQNPPFFQVVAGGGRCWVRTNVG